MAGYGSSDVWRDRLEETQRLLDLARQEIHELRSALKAGQTMVLYLVDEVYNRPDHQLRSAVNRVIEVTALPLFYVAPTVVAKEKSDGSR